MSRWAAVLAGGSGTRFWPLSTPHLPKQLLPLTGDRPLLTQTVQRLHTLVPFDQILIVTGRHLVDDTRPLVPEIPRNNLLAEPRAASTAPALAWATQVAHERDSEAVVLSLHADWHVGDDDAFRRTAARALDVAARHDVLVTVGILPTRPEVGYGYIRPGAPLEHDVRRAQEFIEKPDRARADRLIGEGALWNSGLFAWTARRFFTEVAAHAPELAAHLPLLSAGAPERFFDAVTPVAVDIALFERSDRVAVVPGAFPWDDVGTWSALARVRPTDDAGNVAVGAATLRDTADCIVWADDGAVVADGVRDLVVVRAHGVTLVTTRERAARLKDLLASLSPELRDLA